MSDVADNKLKDQTDPNAQGTGKTLAEAEVQALLKQKEEEFNSKLEEAKKEAASKEKAKLYDTIEAAKKSAAENEKKIKEIEAKAEAERKAEEQKIKDEMDAKERLKLLEAQQEENTKRFNEMMELKTSQFESELKKRDLAVMREKLISEARGEIIPEIVQGNSEEELVQAAEKARARFREIAEAQRKQFADTLIKEGKIPGPDGSDKITEGDKSKSASGQKSLQDIFSMTKDDFLKYKDSVLSQYK